MKNLLWRLIVKCHNINKSVQKGTTPTKEEKFFYKQKDLLLKEICKRVLQQKEIKYSYSIVGNNWFNHILYFEYNNEQISFHASHSYGLDIKDTIEWDGIVKSFVSWEGKYPGKQKEIPAYEPCKSSLKRRLEKWQQLGIPAKCAQALQADLPKR